MLRQDRNGLQVGLALHGGGEEKSARTPGCGLPSPRDLGLAGLHMRGWAAPHSRPFWLLCLTACHKALQKSARLLRGVTAALWVVVLTLTSGPLETDWFQNWAV